MGFHSDMAESSEREKARREKREQLKTLLEEVPLRDVLRLVRERATISSAIENPRERAIVVRYLEDAETRLFASEKDLWSRQAGG